MIARMQAWADRAAGANAGMGGDMRGDASVARTTQSARMPLWTDGDIGHATGVFVVVVVVGATQASPAGCD